MRLLNVQTRTLEEFNAHHVPSYAILSHTWGGEEVLLDDVLTGRAASLGGYAKLRGCCEQARHDGFDYVVRAPEPSGPRREGRAKPDCPD